MKKMLVVLVLFAVAGVPVYLTMTASTFGVSDGAPLGDFETIDAWLLEKKFEKHEGELDTSDWKSTDGVAGSRLFKDKDLSHRDRGTNDQVVVVVDGNDVVKGVGGNFYSGSEDLDYPLSRAEDFIQRLWREAMTGEPAFKEKYTGRGIWQTQWRICSQKSGRLNGRWKKRYMSTMEAKTIMDQVSLHVDM